MGGAKRRHVTEGRVHAHHVIRGAGPGAALPAAAARSGQNGAAMAGAGSDSRFSGLSLVQLHELLEDEAQLAGMVQDMEEVRAAASNRGSRGPEAAGERVGGAPGGEALLGGAGEPGAEAGLAWRAAGAGSGVPPGRRGPCGVRGVTPGASRRKQKERVLWGRPDLAPRCPAAAPSGWGAKEERARGRRLPHLACSDPGPPWVDPLLPQTSPDTPSLSPEQAPSHARPPARRGGLLALFPGAQPPFSRRPPGYFYFFFTHSRSLGRDSPSTDPYCPRPQRGQCPGLPAGVSAFPPL